MFVTRLSPFALRLSPLLLGLLLTGCPETLQNQCPSGSNSVGGFTLVFTQIDAGDFCQVVVLPDGGPTSAPASAVPGPTQATLCASASDGGLIQLNIANQQVRTSALDDAGNFQFNTAALGIAGTQCGCAIDIRETFGGTLQSKSGGPAVFDADGGLSSVGSITASLEDDVTVSDAGTDDSGTICRCNTPCALRYTIVGSPL
jgi:hypothetical protein